MKKLEFKLNLICTKEEIPNIIKKLKKEIKKIDHNILDLDFRLEMVTREMLANAIEHGCQQDEDKIKIKLETSPSTVSLQVQDPGDGFDWKNADFSIPLLEENGRGLGMIDKGADKIEFNEKGNCITVYFITQSKR